MDIFKLAAHRAVVNSNIGVQAIAEKLGKTCPALMRELNPCDERTKLGAETLMQIIKLTGNIEPLQVMARQFGYELIPTKQKR